MNILVMTKKIIGVMGPGKEATKKDIKNAIEIGKLIADNGWVLLTGGQKSGSNGRSKRRS
ncbi:Uncharacterised protein [uncultured archaeon]|nr:Uncharacterised protein [uncultured archaeon]